jgi:hypothetical protein
MEDFTETPRALHRKNGPPPYAGLVMQGAFLVRFGAHRQQDHEELAGRVEEVDSGRSLRFRSGDELLEFLRNRQQDVVTEQEKD